MEAHSWIIMTYGIKKQCSARVDWAPAGSGSAAPLSSELSWACLPRYLSISTKSNPNPSCLWCLIIKTLTLKNYTPQRMMSWCRFLLNSFSPIHLSYLLSIYDENITSPQCTTCSLYSILVYMLTLNLTWDPLLPLSPPPSLSFIVVPHKLKVLCGSITILHGGFEMPK